MAPVISRSQGTHWSLEPPTWNRGRVADVPPTTWGALEITTGCTASIIIVLNPNELRSNTQPIETKNGSNRTLSCFSTKTWVSVSNLDESKVVWTPVYVSQRMWWWWSLVHWRPTSVIPGYDKVVMILLHLDLLGGSDKIWGTDWQCFLTTKQCGTMLWKFKDHYYQPFADRLSPSSQESGCTKIPKPPIYFVGASIPSKKPEVHIPFFSQPFFSRSQQIPSQGTAHPHDIWKRWSCQWPRSCHWP